MNVSDYLQEHLKENGITKQWLAEQLGINYKTFVGKLNRNSISADELIDISHYINLNLEDLKHEIIKERVTDMKMIMTGNLVIPWEEQVDGGEVTQEEWDKFEEKFNKDSRIQRINNGFIFLSDCVKELQKDYPYLIELDNTDDVVDFDETSRTGKEKEFLRKMISKLIKEKGWEEVKEKYEFYLNEIVGLKINWKQY